MHAADSGLCAEVGVFVKTQCARHAALSPGLLGFQKILINREIALATVSKRGCSLEFATEELKSDREIVLAAISECVFALDYAVDALKGDRVFMLAACSKSGFALQFAADFLKHDREVVLTAVSRNGYALEWAADHLKRDPAIVRTAVSEYHRALRFAADGFLEDETFEVEARKEFYFFKITTMSGRYCIVAMDKWNDKRLLISSALKKLGMGISGTEVLLYGDESVCDDLTVPDFPGAPAAGQVVEYQLVR
mmetsp:Transcript_34516/g.78815  ORF Transcript_34516/g.78815 Transcript_34516/m.78815 type:complete len:252 (+) Transcript_34516:58-813(+)